MTDNDAGGIILAFFIASGIGFLVGAMTVDSGWKKACVEQKVAEYHQTTAAWQWKQAAPVTPEVKIAQ